MKLPRNWAIRPLVSAISVLLLLGVLIVVMFTALRSPLKDDIAWLLYVARRLVAGKELYVDVVEVNPPLIIWLSAIPISLARWWNLNQQYVAMPFFAAIVLANAWWSACLLRPLGGLFAARLPVFAVIGAILVLIPASDLGQREHLLVAAFLPYLIVFARSITEGERPHLAASISAGVVAALACAMKPQYGLVFAALELVALRHRLRPWRAAPVAAAVSLVLYIGLVALVCPAYLARAVPMALALYGATDVPFRVLLLYSAPLLAAEGIALLLWWRYRKTLPHASLLMTGLVFAIVSSVICFIDGKDWFYHRLPATVLTVLVLVLWAASTIRDRLTVGPDAFVKRPGSRRGLAVAGVIVGLFCIAAVQRLGPEVRQAVEPKKTTVARLEALIRLHHARTYVAFSEWIALGFPVVNNTGVVWASRFDSMWALKGELWAARSDPAAAREWPIARWVAHDFLSGCPDLVVVDTREQLNYIGVLSTAEPAFARAWSRYKQIVAFDGLKVYKRMKGGCIEPWVAAQGPGAATAIR